MTEFLKSRWLTRFTLCWAAMVHSALADVTSFDDLRFWVGSGPNRAALVIDWWEMPERIPLAWGFRWSGSATGEDMFRAIVQRDPQLYARIGSSGAFGVPLYGIGYDRDGDGFALSDGTIFSNGLAVTGPSDGAIAVDPDDSYNEGWNTGFWAYYVGSGNPYGGGSWQTPITGFSDRQLADGDWDGFSFAPGFVGDPPALAGAAMPARIKLSVQPLAIPEPLGISWVCVTVTVMTCRMRAVAPR
jgi:hypothetical protein